jgi:hypothetical protein
MTRHGFWGTATATLAALVLMLATAPKVRADSPNDDEASRIQRGSRSPQ